MVGYYEVVEVFYDRLFVFGWCGLLGIIFDIYFFSIQIYEMIG